MVRSMWARADRRPARLSLASDKRRESVAIRACSRTRSASSERIRPLSSSRRVRSSDSPAGRHRQSGEAPSDGPAHPARPLPGPARPRPRSPSRSAAWCPRSAAPVALISAAGSAPPLPAARMELSAAWHTLSTALVPPAALGLVSGDRAGPQGSLRSAGPRAGPTCCPRDAPASALPRPGLSASGSAGRVGTAGNGERRPGLGRNGRSCRGRGGTVGAEGATAGAGEQRPGAAGWGGTAEAARGGTAGPEGGTGSCRGGEMGVLGVQGVVSAGGCQGRAAGAAALSPCPPNEEQDQKATACPAVLWLCFHSIRGSWCWPREGFGPGRGVLGTRGWLAASPPAPVSCSSQQQGQQ